MSNKKISFPAKSTLPAKAEDWIENRTAAPEPEPEPEPPKTPSEPMKRLTIDIPESLHRSIKSTCASRGTKIADELREILLEKYGNM